MKKIACLLLFLAVSNLIIGAPIPFKIWYVSAKGNDRNAGTSVHTPFRTLQKAARLVRPGDTVLIDSGEYSSTDISDGSAVLSISISGRRDAWITWKAMAGRHPVIRPKGWSGIQISGCYQVVDGLTIIGNNDSIRLAGALDDAKKIKPNPWFNTNGITVEGRFSKPEEKPHHIIIRNCVVGKCAGGGITMLETDYITVERCKVFNNAWYMRYAGSGITTLNNWAFDAQSGYHIIIRSNMVWNNKTMVPWEATGKLSDGNGILLDVTDQSGNAANPAGDVLLTDTTNNHKPLKAKRPEWSGRALIANNLCVGNGGSGIHTFRTKHVDIFNNTCYWNGQVVGYQELFPNRSDDVVIMNNMIVPKPGGNVTSNNRNTNIVWDYNLYSEPQAIFKGTHDLLAIPLFINPQLDLFKANFLPAVKSPGLKSGTRMNTIVDDINGKSRSSGKGIDIGCYQQ